ncbi:MAG TPA: RluA family pseudouridine synthase [Spirochaetota bacterium]|nr:RluA family pseudouridine synthase [Spirochaetota bacterium]HPJ34738.1 RluA family pseudouridine synthase [Spirochaetota bacterium]
MAVERIIESAVPAEYADSRLDLYLSKRFSYLSRTAWQREIEAGRVELNGTVVLNVKKKVSEGERVLYRPLSLEEPEVDFNYSVIFENENYMAVCKTGNLPVHPAGVFFKNTLVMSLEEKFGKKFYPVHRLDRETSGAILFGKSPEAASSVQNNFSGVKKEYLAFVRGACAEIFSVDLPIGTARNSLIKKKRECYPGAPEEAHTGFKCISLSGEYSFIKAMPVTGRMHQIRVHLKYAGHPIVGDKMYSDDETIYLDYVNSGNSEDIVARAGFHRCALHSSILTYFDCYENRSITVKADLTDDLKDLMKSLHL